MGVLDWVIIGIVAVLLVAAVVYTRRRRKKGLTCCGDCSACGSCTSGHCKECVGCKIPDGQRNSAAQNGVDSHEDTEK